MKRCPKCGEVKPLCEFHKDKYKKDGQCFHYANLQPLWATDNLKKGCKVSGY
jgi:hypothetical protein